MVMAHTQVCAVLRKSACMLSVLCNTNCHRILRHKLLSVTARRSISMMQIKLNSDKPARIPKAVAVIAFDNVSKKEKETFLDVLHMYESQEPLKRGHVEFIKAAMNYMDEFGVSEDLEVYKKLIDVMPKGKFISTSPLQADFMYFPKQQQCIIDLLEKMECNGVIGDIEMEQMLLNIFGQHGIPLRKFWRMMYWMPKFRHLNPWPTPFPVPTDAMELAKLAIEKISSVDPQSVLTTFETESVTDSIDKTWIVSAMSPDQQELLQRHPTNVACYVEGPFKIWVAHMPVDYFILRAEPFERPKTDDVDPDDVTKLDISFWNNTVSVLSRLRSIHDQDDATIFSVCATGTSSKDSLLSWIRCLQRTNPILEKIPVLFTLTKQIQDQEEIEDGGGDSGSKSQPPRKLGDS